MPGRGCLGHFHPILFGRSCHLALAPAGLGSLGSCIAWHDQGGLASKDNLGPAEQHFVACSKGALRVCVDRRSSEVTTDSLGPFRTFFATSL
jgi:hypothetical protein